MTVEQKADIIDILTYYRNLIGVDRFKLDNTIKAFKKLADGVNELSTMEDRMFSAIEAETQISRRQICRPSRSREVVMTKQFACGILKEHGYTSTSSAKVFNMHYSSVLYNIGQDVINNIHDKKYIELRARIRDTFYENNTAKLLQKLAG
jgi:hypothetical protein